ncbi:MAG TPA: hypothetical protein VFW47_12220 [Phenylobacterium sp.]|nr:hypothetical protein [Phenylobacterium sp.]
MDEKFKDFAFRKRGIPSLKALLIVMGVALAAVLAVQWIYQRTVVARREEARLAKWTIQGPPCESVDAKTYDLRGGARAKKAINFGAVFTRQYGHVECSWMGAKDLMAQNAYVVCQFTGPNVIKVETSKGAFYFVPGVGQPATVQVRKDVPRCVLGAKFAG